MLLPSESQSAVSHLVIEKMFYRRRRRARKKEQDPTFPIVHPPSITEDDSAPSNVTRHPIPEQDPTFSIVHPPSITEDDSAPSNVTRHPIPEQDPTFSIVHPPLITEDDAMLSNTTHHPIPDTCIDPLLDDSYPPPRESKDMATDTAGMHHEYKSLLNTHSLIILDLLSFAEKGVDTTSDREARIPAGQVIDLTSFDGFPYPTQSPTVTWPGSRFKTKLPFISHPKNHAVNILQDEATHIQNLAMTATLTSEWVINLEYDKYPNDRAFAQAIANETKWGRTVVISGHPFRRASVELDDLNLRFNYVSDSQVWASG
jgi:hypothetical protein